MLGLAFENQENVIKVERGFFCWSIWLLIFASSLPSVTLILIFPQLRLVLEKVSKNQRKNFAH